MEHKPQHCPISNNQYQDDPSALPDMRRAYTQPPMCTPHSCQPVAPAYPHSAMVLWLANLEVILTILHIVA